MTIPRLQRGEPETFSASGFQPGESVHAVIHSPQTIELASKAANSAGVVSWTFLVPESFDLGMHTAIATSDSIGDSTRAVSFEVYALTPSGGGTAPTGTGSGPVGTSSGGSTSSGGPSTLAATGANAIVVGSATAALLLLGLALRLATTVQRRKLPVR
ncbi:hypothetical protein GCM10025864_33480 [Luteimicrobium album]|uniref:Bacterial Ig-like domain-containing protein n=1 Tax=Luteimicrobium album TaxID=1054550 RepID=A0ABQ6I6M0_9MICO|nr:hypothetical protein [Luteimicrobium album]GMA25589.1 hypothetical protein GCM10025864_33480 [Luteimicrobium album]